jgi:hypothetical protein
MKIKILALSLTIALAYVAAPAYAQLDVSKFPLLNASDWRTAERVPWSEPIVIKDEFDGNYLAVLDKNYNDNIWTGYKSGIVSNWSRKYLRIYSYVSPPCRGYFCQRTVQIREGNRVSIKAGEKIFKLEGKNGVFTMNDEIAYALKTLNTQTTRIKLMFENSGDEIVSDIGAGTVRSWKTVYFDAQVPQNQNTVNMTTTPPSPLQPQNTIDNTTKIQSAPVP